MVYPFQDYETRRSAKIAEVWLGERITRELPRASPGVAGEPRLQSGRKDVLPAEPIGHDRIPEVRNSLDCRHETERIRRPLGRF